MNVSDEAYIFAEVYKANVTLYKGNSTNTSAHERSIAAGLEAVKLFNHNAEKSTIEEIRKYYEIRKD